MKRALKAKRPNFRTVWATLQEVAASQKESSERFDREVKERDERFDREMKEIAATQKETDRLLKESSERLDREMKERDERLKELDRITKENSKAIGGQGHRLGEMVEYIVMPNLKAKFRTLGFEFGDPKVHEHIGEKGNDTDAEIDIILENETDVMIVEVKFTPSIKDINNHLRRMGKVRDDAQLKGDKRKFYGAVAGMVFYDNEKEYAISKGFYVIVPSGDTFTITAPQGDYFPAVWQASSGV